MSRKSLEALVAEVIAAKKRLDDARSAVLSLRSQYETAVKRSQDAEEALSDARNALLVAAETADGPEGA